MESYIFCESERSRIKIGHAVSVFCADNLYATRTSILWVRLKLQVGGDYGRLR